MLSLRNTAYQKGITTVSQVERGRAKPTKRTIAAQALHTKSQELESAYMNGLLSASEMPRQVPAHYDNEELHDILVADAELLEEESCFPDDDEITISMYLQFFYNPTIYLKNILLSSINTTFLSNR